MISVCIATYNGEKYIQEQIETIMMNISRDDEIIVSDDGSTDSTLDILKKYEKMDKRIHVINGPQKGVIANFEHALMNAKGDVIFLSDQDDIWEPNKVKTILNIFYKSEFSVVVHDAVIVNENNRVLCSSFYDWRGSGKGIIKNIIKNSYIGCCMAFRRNLLELVLPIPKNIEMHDQWIGILGETRGGAYFLKKPLLRYRRHKNNISNMKHHSILKMIYNRTIFILNLSRRYFFKI